MEVEQLVMLSLANLIECASTKPLHQKYMNISEMN